MSSSWPPDLKSSLRCCSESQKYEGILLEWQMPCGPEGLNYTDMSIHPECVHLIAQHTPQHPVIAVYYADVLTMKRPGLFSILLVDGTQIKTMHPLRSFSTVPECARPCRYGDIHATTSIERMAATTIMFTGAQARLHLTHPFFHIIVTLSRHGQAGGHALPCFTNFHATHPKKHPSIDYGAAGKHSAKLPGRMHIALSMCGS